MLWLDAPDVEAIEPPSGPAEVWRIATKNDSGNGAGLSALTGFGIANLVGRLRVFAESRTGSGEPPVVSRERDRLSLETAMGAVAASMEHLTEEEVAAEDLRRASFALERLLGRMDAESVLDHLFSSFCIGK